MGDKALETGRSDKIQKPVADSIHIRQDTQKQEEHWRNDKQKLLAHYNQLEQEKKRLKERKQALDEKDIKRKNRLIDKHYHSALIYRPTGANLLLLSF